MNDTFIDKVKPATDLELYEIMVAAYPDTFNENSNDDIWDEVMAFAEDMFGDIELFSEFLGRIVLLTSPMTSAINGELSHCLGKVEVKKGKAYMTTAIKRPVSVINENTI